MLKGLFYLPHGTLRGKGVLREEVRSRRVIKKNKEAGGLTIDLGMDILRVCLS